MVDPIYLHRSTFTTPAPCSFTFTPPVYFSFTHILSLLLLTFIPLHTSISPGSLLFVSYWNCLPLWRTDVLNLPNNNEKVHYLSYVKFVSSVYSSPHLCFLWSLMMGFWQPLTNLRDYVSQNPPGTTFFLCLLTLAISFICLSFYSNTHTLPNPDITKVRSDFNYSNFGFLLLSVIYILE